MQCSKSGQAVPLCFPNFFSDKQGLKKDSPGPSEKNVDCSSHMAVSGITPNPSENVNREATSFATPSTSSINQQDQIHPLITSKTLRLAVWMVSGKGCLQQEFQRGLPSSFQIQGDKVYYQITVCPGLSGLAGVTKENLIHFDVLCAKC